MENLRFGFRVEREKKNKQQQHFTRINNEYQRATEKTVRKYHVHVKMHGAKRKMLDWI